MSVLIVVCGSASNWSQLHLPSGEPFSCRAKVQFSTLICGVGPAERTGKSVVTYCPGGTLFLGVCSCRVDLKPREMGALSMEVLPVLLGAALCFDEHDAASCARQRQGSDALDLIPRPLRTPPTA